MPLIKPRTRGKEFVRLVTRLEHETNETLAAYAAFLGEPVEYVLNQLIDTVLAKDKEFVEWRTTHTQSFARQASSAKKATTGPGSNGTRESAAGGRAGSTTAAGAP